jgi:hypothetical protein
MEGQKVKFSGVSLALKVAKFSWGRYLEYTTTAIWDELGEYGNFRLIRVDQAFNIIPMNGNSD